MDNNSTTPTPISAPAVVAVEKMKATTQESVVWFGIIISLYACVSALLTILFTVFDKAMPDALDRAYFFTGSGIGVLSAPMSVLIILFPVLTILTHIAQKIVIANPERLKVPFRKKIFYITLFLTAVMVIVDLITLVGYFLNGEITTRFIWKVLCVLVVGGMVGSYYFFQLKKDETTVLRNSTDVIFSVLAWGIVVATFIYSFAVFGSPQNQRALGFDTQRVQNLGQIENSVLNYWQQKGKMPQALTDLEYVPKDPEAITGKVLEYHVGSGTSYQVCADFGTSSSKESEMNYLYNSNSYYDTDRFVPKNSQEYPWKHSSGHTCFKRVIDTVQYPVNANVIKNTPTVPGNIPGVLQ